MKSSVAAIVLLLITVVQAVQETPSEQECARLVKKGDRCFDELFLLRYPKIPGTMAEMDTYCKKTPKLIFCIRSSANCYKGFKKSLINLVMRGFRKFLNEQCKTIANKEIIIKDFKCSGGNLAPVKEMMDKLTVTIDLATVQSDANKIPYLCCGYHSIEEKMKNITRTMCADWGFPLKEDEKHFFHRMAIEALYEVIDLMCGKLTSVTSCYEQRPKDMQLIVSHINDENNSKFLDHGVVTAITNFLNVMDQSIEERKISL